jgi:predicted O-linked N-acetylglucosamine transferase (SPINDLY family)
MDPPPGWEKSHFEVYQSIDMLLDAFPFSGHTTVVESLWMGVPAVTLTGNRFAGRMAASILTRIGMTEFIAQSPEQYVSIAAHWAENSERVAELRSGLREGMRSSPLCDGRQFTKIMEDAFRKMWQAWCSRGDSGPRGHT